LLNLNIPKVIFRCLGQATGVDILEPAQMCLVVQLMRNVKSDVCQP